MKNFCTLSDVNFLPFGLALHDSLKRNFDDDFKLFYLCTDDASYDKLTLSDKSLSRARENQPSYEAVNVANRTGASAKEIQYFWCLSPYLSWHILDNYDIEDVLYVDSDIYFFNNLKKIYDEIGNKSVGVVRHIINYNPAVDISARSGGKTAYYILIMNTIKHMEFVAIKNIWNCLHHFLERIKYKLLMIRWATLHLGILQIINF